MEPITLCILTFPQRYANGRLYFNIVIIPRNLNPLLPLKAGLEAFADANIVFKPMVINSLDGLPLTTSDSTSPNITIESDAPAGRLVWESLKTQLETIDGLKINDAHSADQSQKANADLEKYKSVAIRKYLPETYRSAFNFVKAKTKFALIGDEYHCSVKNKDPKVTDENTARDVLSWGKVIAYCLRNPALAEKAGLIYRASIALDADEKLFENGGWLYTEFAEISDFNGIAKMQYAARIPALKGLNERAIFSAVQFPVPDNPINNSGYDEILKDAIVYDDGFAKIVHANQPINQDLLQESDHSNPPLKDIGIRLGWDDEQIAIWHNRQMLQKEEVSGNSIDAPLGVFGYKLDVRKKGDVKWLSQNSLIAKQTMSLANGEVNLFENGDLLEPGIEIHPTAHGNSKNDGFWLPIYFSGWAGKPVTLADKDAEDISQLTAEKMVVLRPDIENSINTIPKKVFHPYLANPEFTLPLVYGEDYEFRVRLMDISGGGPKVTDEGLNGGEKPITEIHFKRHIAAGALKIATLENVYNALPKGTPAVLLKDTSILQNIINGDNPILSLKRPLLAYPAVVYTGKYNNVVEKLKAILNNIPADSDKQSVDIGLADPNVDFFKVRVEAKSLEMDNGRSENGKEPFILLYEKEYRLEQASDDYDQTFELEIIHEDIKVIDLVGGFDDTGTANQLVLPTSRQLRLTFIPLIKAADNDYADTHILEGKKLILSSYQPAKDERKLLSPIDGGLKAVYLQPEKVADDRKVQVIENGLSLNLVQSSTPVELKRLADSFNLNAHQLTLEGEKGKRVQFGCSKIMRHSLAPDSSSLSFSSLSELFNHWVIGIDYSLDRDWAWDGLEKESISIFRKWRKEADNDFGEEEFAGIINVSDTVSINALANPERDHSRLIFLDVFDPKIVSEPFPSEVMVSYRIVVNFKSEGIPEQSDELTDKEIHLPITIIPKQIPKLISAGIAMTPYSADPAKYTFTDHRQRFLWLEVDEPPLDPNDTYFARVLSNAPDPLICDLNQKLLTYDPVDPALSIDEEKIRTIIPGMNNDFAGIGAMQEMLRGDDDSGKSNFYMLPLPPGMHADSDELFGFFSYELRLGHKKEAWSTAQGRYGRPLKVNGVQHPAPALSCNAFRRKTPIYTPLVKKQLIKTRSRGTLSERIVPVLEQEIETVAFKNEMIITAPFAVAVLNGENVTARPPQTSLWYMLYTQVKQADGLSYRNLLIDSAQLVYSTKASIQHENVGNVLAVSPILTQPKVDEIKTGMAILKVSDVESRLQEMGLPPHNSLSVLCVEMFPTDNKWHFDFGRRRSQEDNQIEALNPLTTGLGAYRIYRTSSLVPIAGVCCDDC